MATAPDTPFTSVALGNEWDTLVLQPYVFPGTAYVETTVKYSYTVGKPQGTDLAHIEYKGIEPRELSVKILITLTSEYETFAAEILPGLKAKANSANKEVRPFVIDHPQAKLLGINQVHITQIDLPNPNSRSGWEIRLKLLEHSDTPKKAKSSDKAEKSSGRNNNTRTESGTEKGSYSSPEVEV